MLDNQCKRPSRALHTVSKQLQCPVTTTIFQMLTLSSHSGIVMVVMKLIALGTSIGRYVVT